MKFLWLFFAVYCHFVNADEISPQTVVENYFESFNNMDRAALNALSGEPFIFVRAGKASVYSKYGDAVDFDGIKASGWSYSRIHKSDLIYQDDISAMVSINFSRYSEGGLPISTADVVYLLIKVDGSWLLKGGFIDGNLTLGKD